MIFSSNLFIFGSMPLFFAAYFWAPWLVKNGLFLLGGLAFYDFGAGPMVMIRVASIAVNYAAALAIEDSFGRQRQLKLIFWLAAVADLAALFYYKYFNFAWQVADDLGGSPATTVGKLRSKRARCARVNCTSQC